MPRLTVSVPKYRLHKASGRAVVTLSGRDIYLGKYGSEESRQKYDQVIAEWLEYQRQTPASSRTGARPDVGSLDVNQLFVAYWRWAESYYVEGGEATRELENLGHAVRPLIDLYGRTLVTEFSPIMLKAIRQQMIDDDLARKTINDRVNRIRRMFKWGTENALVEPEIFQALQAIAPLKRGRYGVREGKGVKPVPQEYIDAVLPLLPPTLRAMINVQLLTGMRPGELVIMRTGDLEMDKKRCEYRPQTHKTAYFGHQRIIAIGPRARSFIEPYLSTDLDAYIFNPRRAMEERWADCASHRSSPNQQRKTARKLGERYDTSSYLRAIYHACDVAFEPPGPLARRTVKGKLESASARYRRLTTEQRKQLNRWQRDHRWHPHQLRHNAATNFRKHHGIEVARIILGHRSTAVTEIYAERDQDIAREIVGRVG